MAAVEHVVERLFLLYFSPACIVEGGAVERGREKSPIGLFCSIYFPCVTVFESWEIKILCLVMIDDFLGCFSKFLGK